MAFGSLFDNFTTAHAKLRLHDAAKENVPVPEKPGSWDSKVANANTTTTPDRAPPSMNKIPPGLAKGFPKGRLMADQPNVLKCTHCKRPVLRHAMPAHIERCLEKKQEKLRKKKEAKDARDAAARRERNSGDASDDEIDVDGSSTRNSTAAGKGGLTASKKRKDIDENAEEAGPSKKKKRKDAAADKLKAPKTKSPVDVEKQCGVELPQGGQCARSLTCKSHSMGAKRAVPGRSAPYDKLLNEYQRKNQAKLQKAAFDANAPAGDFDDEAALGPVDSEEEKEAVMGAIARCWGGKPLGERERVPLRRKYEFNRFKGMLGSALGGRGSGGGGTVGGGFFGNVRSGGGGGFFAPAPVVVVAAAGGDVDGGVVLQARKGSVIPGVRSMMAPAGSRQKAGLAA